MIKSSEAEREQQINIAAGQAEAILAVANATANGIKLIAQAVNQPGGYEALQLRVAEQYLEKFGELAKVGNSLIIPANIADVSSMVASALEVIKRTKSAAT